MFRDQPWSRGIDPAAHHLPSMQAPMDRGFGPNQPRSLAWSAADETRIVFPWLALQWTIYMQAAMDAATYRLHEESQASGLDPEHKHEDPAYEEKMYQAGLRAILTRFQRDLEKVETKWGRTGSLNLCCDRTKDYRANLISACGDLKEHLVAPYDSRVEACTTLLAKLGWERPVSAARMAINPAASSSDAANPGAGDGDDTLDNDMPPMGGGEPEFEVITTVDQQAAIPPERGVGYLSGMTSLLQGSDSVLINPNPNAVEGAGKAAAGDDQDADAQAAAAVDSGDTVKAAAADPEAKSGESDAVKAAVKAAAADPESKSGDEVNAAAVAENDNEPAALGRPLGAKNVLSYSMEEIKEQVDGRFKLYPRPWEDLKDREAKELCNEIGSKTRCELFLADPWYEQKQFYTAAYFEEYLTAMAPFASPEAVCVYFGRSAEIHSLIAKFALTKAGRRAIKETGWGWVDKESFEIVNASLSTSRAGGMVSNRQAAVVVYMKKWNTKAHKAIFTQNAKDPGFWLTFPDAWCPPKAHQNNVMTNTLTGYRPTRKMLKNPATNTRVRPGAEKNPMVYIYLMQKYTKGPDSLVIDCFGGTMASVLAAMRTDNKVVAFEIDTKLVPFAEARILELAQKLAHKAGAPLGQIKAPMAIKRAKKGKKKEEDELLEYSYGRMIADANQSMRLTDPRFPPQDPAVQYDLEKAAKSYGVEIREVKAIGQGLFTLGDIPEDSTICPVLGRWVRQSVMRLPTNADKEYIVFPGPDRRQWAFEMNPIQLAIKINDYRGGLADEANCRLEVDDLTLKEYHHERAARKAAYEAENPTAPRPWVDPDDLGYIQVVASVELKAEDQLFLNYGNMYWRGRKDLGGVSKKKEKKKKGKKEKEKGSASEVSESDEGSESAREEEDEESEGEEEEEEGEEEEGEEGEEEEGEEDDDDDDDDSHYGTPNKTKSSNKRGSRKTGKKPIAIESDSESSSENDDDDDADLSEGQQVKNKASRSPTGRKRRRGADVVETTGSGTPVRKKPRKNAAAPAPPNSKSPKSPVAADKGTMTAFFTKQVADPDKTDKPKRKKKSDKKKKKKSKKTLS